MPKYWFSIFLFFNTLCYSQIDSTLITIKNKELFEIGKEQFTWACVANFTLSDPKNYGRIKFLDTDNKGNVFVIDNNGFLYALSGIDFSEKWKIHLGYEHILDMSVSPDGSTLAICYNYIKTATKKLEIRNTKNGRIHLKMKEKPDCYEDSYFVDVVDNTTLYPFNICYSPDGSRLAVWFKNHGFDENKCIAILEEKLLIINPLTGDVLVSKKHIPKDFEWDKCNFKFPFAFSTDGQSIYIGNCMAQIAQYDARNLSLIRVENYLEQIQKIEIEELGVKASRKSKIRFNEIFVQNNGTLLVSVGKKGRVYKINSDLSTISFVTEDLGNEQGHFSCSPDLQIGMLNSNNLNLWDLDTKQPILFTETAGVLASNTVRFHPLKKAIIVGAKRTIKIIAPCPVSNLYIADHYTSTGHYINAETSFSVRGKGRIYWAYDQVKIYQKYAKDDEISTKILGYSSLFNNQQNIPQSSELLIKTDNPGIYTIFGGTLNRLSNNEILENLEEWGIN